jgi:hypothetical protein
MKLNSVQCPKQFGIIAVGLIRKGNAMRLFKPNVNKFRREKDVRKLQALLFDPDSEIVREAFEALLQFTGRYEYNRKVSNDALNALKNFTPDLKVELINNLPISLRADSHAVVKDILLQKISRGNQEEILSILQQNYELDIVKECLLSLLKTKISTEMCDYFLPYYKYYERSKEEKGTTRQKLRELLKTILPNNARNSLITRLKNDIKARKELIANEATTLLVILDDVDNLVSDLSDIAERKDIDGHQHVEYWMGENEPAVNEYVSGESYWFQRELAKDVLKELDIKEKSSIETTKPPTTSISNSTKKIET